MPKYRREIAIPLGTVLPTDMFEEALRFFEEAQVDEEGVTREIILSPEAFDHILELQKRPPQAPPALVELCRSRVGCPDEDE